MDYEKQYQNILLVNITYERQQIIAGQCNSTQKNLRPLQIYNRKNSINRLALKTTKTSKWWQAQTALLVSFYQK